MIFFIYLLANFCQHIYIYKYIYICDRDWAEARPIFALSRMIFVHLMIVDQSKVCWSGYALNGMGYENNDLVKTF